MKDLAPGESLTGAQKDAILEDAADTKKAEKEKADEIKKAKASAALGIGKAKAEASTSGEASSSSSAAEEAPKGFGKVAAGKKTAAGGGAKAVMAL